MMRNHNVSAVEHNGVSSPTTGFEFDKVDADGGRNNGIVADTMAAEIMELSLTRFLRWI